MRGINNPFAPGAVFENRRQSGVFQLHFFRDAVAVAEVDDHHREPFLLLVPAGNRRHIVVSAADPNPAAAQSVENFQDIKRCLRHVVFHKQAEIAAEPRVVLLDVKKAGPVDVVGDKRAGDCVGAPGGADFVIVRTVAPPCLVPFSHHGRSNLFFDFRDIPQVAAKRADLLDEHINMLEIFVPAYKVKRQALLRAVDHKPFCETFTVEAVAALFVLKGAACKGRAADLRLRVGAKHAFHRRLVELAIRFKAADRLFVHVIASARLAIDLAELFRAGVLGAGLEPAGIYFIPHLPEGNAVAAVDAAFGCTVAEILPERILLGSALPVMIDDCIKWNGHVGDGEDRIGLHLSCNKINAAVEIAPIIDQFAVFFAHDLREDIVHAEPPEASFTEFGCGGIFVIGKSASLAETGDTVGDRAFVNVGMKPKLDRAECTFRIGQAPRCFAEAVASLNMCIDLDKQWDLFAGRCFFLHQDKSGMVVVKPAFERIADPDLSSSRTLDPETDWTAHSGASLDGFRHCKFSCKPSELVFVGDHIARFYLRTPVDRFRR